MAWFKVDDQFYDHPKVADLPLSAIGLWIKAGSYCARYETDGSLTSARVQPLGGRTRDADRLVEAGLWHRVDGGYQFHDWDQYQPTKAQQDAEREKARERMRKRRSGGTSDDVRANSGRSSATPTRPDPTPIYNKANDEKFQEFWDAYPKQTGRAKALTEWHRAVTQGVAPDVLTAKARNYAEQVSHEQRETRFVKAPSNWLREGDYHNTWKPSQPPMTAEQRRMANLPRVVPGEFY